jgi:hypothetical protein
MNYTTDRQRHRCNRKREGRRDDVIDLREMEEVFKRGREGNTNGVSWSQKKLKLKRKRIGNTVDGVREKGIREREKQIDIDEVREK